MRRPPCRPCPPTAAAVDCRADQPCSPSCANAAALAAYTSFCPALTRLLTALHGSGQIELVCRVAWQQGGLAAPQVRQLGARTCMHRYTTLAAATPGVVVGPGPCNPSWYGWERRLTKRPVASPFSCCSQAVSAWAVSQLCGVSCMDELGAQQSMSSQQVSSAWLF